MPPTLPRALVAVLAGALAVLGLAAGGAAADPYPGTVPTACTVSMKATSVGQRLVAVIDVSASGTSPTAGRLEAAFTGPDGPLGVATAEHTQGQVVLRGPKAVKKGHYEVSVGFSPGAKSLFASCTDSDGVQVGVLGAGAGNDDGPGNGDQADDDQGAAPQAEGALPDTGGPPRWLVPLAVGLLLAGAAFLAAGQRRHRRRRRRRYLSFYVTGEH